MDATIRNPLALALTLALAACGTPPGSDANTAPSPAEAPRADATPAADVPPPLGIATADGIGDHLVDATGRAVYAFDQDVGAATCYDACAQRWPALLQPAGEGDAVVAAPLDPARHGTFERTDGGLQHTYGGHPLYLFVGDASPGQHEGHDLTDEFGHWSLVGPDGQPIAMKAAATP